MMDQDHGASLRETGSREPSPVGLGPSGFDPARSYSAYQQGERAALLQVRSFIISHGRAHVDAFCAQRLHDIAMDARHDAERAANA